jgi:hypothetical protein
MSDRDPNDSALGHLALSPGVRTKALQLLASIERAPDLAALQRATERAEGFTEALEVLRALNPQDLEGLYLAIDTANQQRVISLQAVR